MGEGLTSPTPESSEASRGSAAEIRLLPASAASRISDLSGFAVGGGGMMDESAWVKKPPVTVNTRAQESVHCWWMFSVASLKVSCLATSVPTLQQLDAAAAAVRKEGNISGAAWRSARVTKRSEQPGGGAHEPARRPRRRQGRVREDKVTARNVIRLCRSLQDASWRGFLRAPLAAARQL